MRNVNFLSAFWIKSEFSGDFQISEGSGLCHEDSVCKTLSSDKVHTSFRAAIALTLFSTSWMKVIKLRQKKCEDLKQTKSPLGEEQHLQDAGEAAASLCVCADNDSKRRGWQQQLGAGKSQGAISCRKDDVGRWEQPSRMRMCLHRQPGHETLPSRSCTQSCPLPSATQRDWVYFSQTFSTLSLPNTAAAQHTSMYMENYFLPDVPT